MSEKNILAYFRTPEDAKKAEEKLKEMGAIDTQVDRFSRYPGEGVEQIMNPITSDFPSLAYLTQGTVPTTRNDGILLSADVSASGMSDGGVDTITGKDILLVAVVDESIHHQALKVVEEYGGEI